jgi:hypothetical protein
MNPRIRRLIPATVLATALGASGLLLVAAVRPAPAPPRRTPVTAAPACLPAPAPCGNDSLDELAIHAANEAARRMIELRTTGTTDVTYPSP